MTKEEAIENIKLIRFNAAITNANSFKEALDMAIETLSQPSLPSNLDEAAEDCIQGLIPEAELSATTPFALEYVIEMLYKTFRAGAEWMAGQGETIEGEVCGRVRDHINVKFSDGVGELLTPSGISHIPADVSKYNIGDKVVVQIRKK